MHTFEQNILSYGFLKISNGILIYRTVGKIRGF